MKIDRPIGTPVSTVLTNLAAPARKPTEADAAPKTTATQVQLSPQMQALEGQVSVQSHSTFDAKKVQDIRAAIAEGRFQVNAGNVADGLLASVQELIRSNPQDGKK